MSKFEIQNPIIHTPNLKIYRADRITLEFDIPHDRVWQGVRLLDRQYWYVSHEDWGKVFADVLLNMPRYTTDRFDCEDYAFLTKVRILERYKLNAVAIVTGEAPFGGHAWNWFYDGNGWSMLEPQTGEVFPVDTGGYITKWILV